VQLEHPGDDEGGAAEPVSGDRGVDHRGVARVGEGEHDGADPQPPDHRGQVLVEHLDRQ
jgi:hypothetical protein